ncbi:hypothetical protein NECID01_1803 [Nematocida sp. AWRm77]|nr:hypothetical protein NECID01_1803 [Nematocida sp. AWRm77]
MSKFFEGLDEEKKSAGKTVRNFFEEESEEEKPRISNKEKRLEEITELCRETKFKKPKDVDAFFKALGKYAGYFSKVGVPKVLAEFLNEANTKSVASVFKQRKAKFLEKYEDVTVILNIKEEKRAKASHMDQINKALLEDNLEKRKALLLELEKTPDLTEVEQHRINLYIIGCITEETPMTGYKDVVSRLIDEKALATTEEETSILKTRVMQCIKKLVAHIYSLHAQKKAWQEEFAGLEKVAAELLPITDIPDKGRLEVVYFLAPEEASLAKEEPEKYPLFAAVKQIRVLPYTEALEVYTALKEERNSTEESHTDTVCHSKIAEELGHRAFAERDFTNAISMLEQAYYSQTVWSLPSTETILSALALCFEKRMQSRKYFEAFKQSLYSIGNNILLLKTDTPKEEISRAFIFLRLGEYQKAEEILRTLFPAFECRALLKARALEILFAE